MLRNPLRNSGAPGAPRTLGDGRGGGGEEGKAEEHRDAQSQKPRSAGRRWRSFQKPCSSCRLREPSRAVHGQKPVCPCSPCSGLMETARKRPFPKPACTRTGTSQVTGHPECRCESVCPRVCGVNVGVNVCV